VVGKVSIDGCNQDDCAFLQSLDAVSHVPIKTDYLAGRDNALGAGAEADRTRYDLNRNGTLCAVLAKVSSLLEDHEKNIQRGILHKACGVAIPRPPFRAGPEAGNLVIKANRDHPASGGMERLSAVLAGHSKTPISPSYSNINLSAAAENLGDRALRMEDTDKHLNFVDGRVEPADFSLLF